MTIKLIDTYPDIRSVWFLYSYKNTWLIRTSKGIFSIDSKQRTINWFVPIQNEEFFSFKPFVVLQDILIFSSQAQKEAHAQLLAIDTANGEKQWQRQLHWSKLSHLAGISSLQNEIILLDWLADQNQQVELQQIDPQTGNLIKRVPAVRLNATAIDTFGPKSSAVTPKHIYFCQRNKAIYQFGNGTSSNELEVVLTGKVQQIASYKNYLFAYIWEDGKDVLLKIDETSGDIERQYLPLGDEEEVASLIALHTPENRTLVAVLLQDRKGIALVDFMAPGWKWRVNDDRSRFDSAVWTSFGIACIVEEKQGFNYTTEIRILDEKTGAVLESIQPSSTPDNWLSWQDGLLLASTSSGLHLYELGEAA